jgi:hypothetical protein
MDAKDPGERSTDKNDICRLEWIAWAIEAARRHKEDEQRDPETRPPARANPLRVASGPR